MRFRLHRAVRESEKELRNEIIDCEAQLPGFGFRPGRNELADNQQRARCQKLHVELSMIMKSRPSKPNYEPTTTAPPFDNSAALGAQMQAQQAEMQRQQAEIQRMQQQQKLNQIWKK